jgi:hypothetical protein
MRIPSTLQDEPLNAAAQAKEACEEIRAIEEQREQANNDAVFELACRVIVMKSLPAWIDEICAEHLGRSTDSLRKMAVAPLDSVLRAHGSKCVTHRLIVACLFSALREI